MTLAGDTTMTDLTRPPEYHYYEDLLSRYGQMRQFLPTLRRTVDGAGLDVDIPHLGRPAEAES